MLFFEGMKAQFGMTWLMEKVYMLLNTGWSGMSVLRKCNLTHALSGVYVPTFSYRIGEDNTFQQHTKHSQIIIMKFDQNQNHMKETMT